MKWWRQFVTTLLAFSAGIAVERMWLAPAAPTSDRSGTSSVPSSVLDLAFEEAEPSQRPGESREEDQHRRAPRHTLSEWLARIGEHEDHVREALHQHSPEEIRYLLDTLEASGQKDRRARQMKHALYMAWAHKDPKQALARALEENDIQLRREVVHHAFGNLLEQEGLTAATAAFLDLPSRRLQEEAAHAIVDRVEPDQLATLADFFATHSPNAAIHPLYGRWASHDPLAASQHALASTQPEAIHAVARHWAEVDAAAAVSWAQTLEQPHHRAIAMRSAVEAMAQEDPQTAAQLIADWPANGERRELVEAIAHHWGREDLQGALAWSRALEGPGQQEALASITHVWAQSDPAAAAEFALALPPSQQRERALSEVAHVWAERDATQARAWIDQLGAQEALPAMRGLVHTMAEFDPASAASLVAEWSTRQGVPLESEPFVDLAGDLAHHWTERDPASAAGWAQSFPESSDLHEHAVRRVADAWVQRDTLAASEWIGSLPEGRARDAATERLVDEVAATDPEAAYHWALSASTADHQTEMLHHVFEQWQDVDPAAARTTWEGAPLTAEQREHLTRVFAEPR